MEKKLLVALFIALIVILAIDPRIMYNSYNQLIGRIVLIAVLIFFTMHNTTLGLLVALILIISLNKFSVFAEGLETMTASTMAGNTASTPTTIGEDNVPITGSQPVLTRDATKNISNTPNPTISELKDKQAIAGVDKEDIRNSILPKDSKTIPVNPATMKSSDSVSAHSPNTIAKAPLTEGFCPCLTSYSNLYNFS